MKLLIFILELELLNEQVQLQFGGIQHVVVPRPSAPHGGSASSGFPRAAREKALF